MPPSSFFPAKYIYQHPKCQATKIHFQNFGGFCPFLGGPLQPTYPTFGDSDTYATPIPIFAYFLKNCFELLFGLQKHRIKGEPESKY
jgi:hypothetical protein